MVSKNYCGIARQYMEGVLSGVIVACEWVKLACQRQKEDLERFAASGLYIFNEAKGNEVCRFIELLTHTKGALAGKRIVLEPWQIFILTTSFGWRRRADGGRRFKCQGETANPVCQVVWASIVLLPIKNLVQRSTVSRQRVIRRRSSSVTRSRWPNKTSRCANASVWKFWPMPFMYHRQTLLFKPRVRKDQRWTA